MSPPIETKRPKNIYATLTNIIAHAIVCPPSQSTLPPNNHNSNKNHLPPLNPQPSNRTARIQHRNRIRLALWPPSRSITIARILPASGHVIHHESPNSFHPLLRLVREITRIFRDVRRSCRIFPSTILFLRSGNRREDGQMDHVRSRSCLVFTDGRVPLFCCLDYIVLREVEASTGQYTRIVSRHVDRYELGPGRMVKRCNL